MSGSGAKIGTDPYPGGIALDPQGPATGDIIPPAQYARVLRGEPVMWAKQLCFAYDVRDPGAVRISIGGTIAPAGLYGVQEGGPHPADVGVETGIVKYRLSGVGWNGSSRSDADSGLLLVQLLDDRRMKIEYFADGRLADVKDFTGKARIYAR
jgi:hypothetical protein